MLPLHDYHYGNEAEQYTFYRLPKILFSDIRYKSLSDSAKILYGLMLDRMALSIRNEWLDEKNRVFIYFTLEDIQEYMNCGHNKGVKIMAELISINLIERIKQGQGKPSIIYVKKFIVGSDSSKYPAEKKLSNSHEEVQTSEKRKSRLPLKGSADFKLYP